MTDIPAVASVSDTGSRPRSRHADLRLLPVALAGYVAAWLGPVLPLGVALLCGVVLAGCGIAMATTRRPPRPAHGTLCAVLLCSAGIGAVGVLRTRASHAPPVPALARAHAAVLATLTVTDDPRTVAAHHAGRSQPLTVVPARLDTILLDRGRLVAVHDPVTVMADGEDRDVTAGWSGLLPSTRVRVAGRLAPPGAGWPEAALLSVRRAPETVRGPSTVQRLAGHLRASLRAAVASLPADRRGLVPALVIGDTSGEPASLAAALRDTGLTHFAVIDGENLVFFIGVILPAARRFGVRGRLVQVVGALTVVAFTILGRPEPSVVRGAVMTLLTLAALVTGRRRGGVASLCAATLLLLLLDPGLSREYGFALSVAATVGMALVASVWRDRSVMWRMPHRVAESVIATATAELFCLPLIVTFTSTVTLVSIPANLFAEVAVGPAIGVGAIAMLAGSLWRPAGYCLGWMAQWPAAWVASVARGFAALPGSRVPWPAGWGGALALLAVYALGALLVTRLTRRRGRRRDGEPRDHVIRPPPRWDRAPLVTDVGGAWHAVSRWQSTGSRPATPPRPRGRPLSRSRWVRRSCWSTARWPPWSARHAHSTPPPRSTTSPPTN